VKKGDIMMDIDLLYVTYRQQELWQEAAAQALTAQVYPARWRWLARVLDTLTTLFSGGPWPVSRRSHAGPVPGVVHVSPPRYERKHVW
jgi:hypothetical protein